MADEERLLGRIAGVFTLLAERETRDGIVMTPNAIVLLTWWFGQQFLIARDRGRLLSHWESSVPAFTASLAKQAEGRDDQDRLIVNSRAAIAAIRLKPPGPDF